MGFLGIQAANEGRATNKGMSIAGIVLSLAGTVLNIVLYMTGVTAQLTSGFQS